MYPACLIYLLFFCCMAEGAAGPWQPSGLALSTNPISTARLSWKTKRQAGSFSLLVGLRGGGRNPRDLQDEQSKDLDWEEVERVIDGLERLEDTDEDCDFEDGEYLMEEVDEKIAILKDWLIGWEDRIKREKSHQPLKNLILLGNATMYLLLLLVLLNFFACNLCGLLGRVPTTLALKFLFLGIAVCKVCFASVYRYVKTKEQRTIPKPLARISLFCIDIGNATAYLSLFLLALKFFSCGLCILLKGVPELHTALVYMVLGLLPIPVIGALIGKDGVGQRRPFEPEKQEGWDSHPDRTVTPEHTAA